MSLPSQIVTQDSLMSHKISITFQHFESSLKLTLLKSLLVIDWSFISIQALPRRTLPSLHVSVFCLYSSLALCS